MSNQKTELTFAHTWKTFSRSIYVILKEKVSTIEANASAIGKKCYVILILPN